MARPILFLTALLLALPAISADDNKGRGEEKKALQADCEQQANQQNLIGKQRKKFVKECTKEGKHAKRRGEGRDKDARPAATPPAQPASQTAAPAAPPSTTAPAPTPAAQPTTPGATVPAQPAATPASPPPAATPAATPPPSKPVLTAEQKLAKCTEEAQRANTIGSARKRFIEKCMAL